MKSGACVVILGHGCEIGGCPGPFGWPTGAFSRVWSEKWFVKGLGADLFVEGLCSFCGWGDNWALETSPLEILDVICHLARFEDIVYETESVDDGSQADTTLLRYVDDACVGDTLRVHFHEVAVAGEENVSVLRSKLELVLIWSREIP